MTAIEKEQIFVKLREYHLEEFPETMATTGMTDFYNDFKKVEDDLISMILALVNGKTGYVDYTSELESFKKDLAITKETDSAELENRTLFLSKIDLLEQILHLSDKATFMIKVPRNGPRQVGKAVTTKTTRA